MVKHGFGTNVGKHVDRQNSGHALWLLTLPPMAFGIIPIVVAFRFFDFTLNLPYANSSAKLKDSQQGS
jgi:hypothetical protein